MIFATLVMVALGRRISLRSRMLIRESMNTATLSGLVRLTRYYGLIALTIELAGALLLAIRFVPRFGVGAGCTSPCSTPSAPSATRALTSSATFPA